MKISEIKELLREFEISPKRSLGQNFLVNQHCIEKIISKASEILEGDLVEIGPGLGSLTRRLIEEFFSSGASDGGSRGAGGDVNAGADEEADLRRFQIIELDRVFSRYWRDFILSPSNHSGHANFSERISVIEGDALKVDWASLELKPNSLLVSNLPYQISSSIVVERSVAPTGISKMILMFQKEVAERIQCDGNGKTSKEYGFLSVIAQVFWKIRTLVDAAPKDFYPPPNISSRVLFFERRDEQDSDWSFAHKNPEFFMKFVKAAFQQRRKKLEKNLQQAHQALQICDLKIKPAMDEMQLAEGVRAEHLTPNQFVELSRRLF